MAKQRNGSIDLLKFLLILSVTLYHGIKIWGSQKGVIFYNGGSAVEPFYIIAGFFMAHSAFKKNKDSFTYMWGRYKEVFPYHIFAFVIAFLFRCWRLSYFELPFLQSAKEIVLTAIKSVPEFFLLAPITGLQKELGSINGIEWYLGAMLIGMAILYPLLRKWPRQFSSYAAPLIFLFGSGVLMQTNNASYIITFDTIWIICGGLIRAITMLAIGTFVYRMTEIAKEKFDPAKGTTRLWITIAAFLCWIVSFWFFWTNQERSLEFAVVYFMIAGVFFSCLGMTYTNKVLGNRFVNWLAKLSFPMFLNQSWVRKVFMLLPLKEAGLSYGVIMLLFVAAVIIVSIICMLVMDKIMDLIHKRKTQAATV